MLGYVPKSLVADILAHTEHGHRGRGSIKNPVCEGYVPKNLVVKILPHGQHGHRGPGSIKNPVCEGYVPKNLVAKILGHGEHGHRGPGLSSWPEQFLAFVSLVYNYYKLRQVPFLPHPAARNKLWVCATVCKISLQHFSMATVPP